MDVTAESNGKDSSENAQQSSNTEEKNSTTPPQEVQQPKKSKREDRTKKDDKNVEQFMKSLNSVPTLEEKLSLVCKKYVQTADENKTLHFIVKQSEKRFALLLKEKDQLQLEFNKTVLVKSKLENLCRELQKQNKAIKEESLLKIKEEEERRKETQAKFQNTLSEITTLLQQNNEKNAKLRDDNINMSEKFKSVLQQYQLREQQVDKMAKQMTLESQLSDAKLQKANLEYRAEKERLLAEMEKLKLDTEQYKAKIAELQNAEGLLRSQINVYTGKYDEFQNALQRSNQVFVGFKGEMDKMSKKIQKLEKESIMWKRRWETSQASLLQVCTEKQTSDENMASTQRHLDQMQRLCRTLQAERTVLLNTLKEHNIERPPLPPPAPLPPAAPPVAPANSNKVEAMAANCVQLRQSLAELQNQLNVLTNKNQTKEEQKPEKQKKSKSRKKKDNAKLDAQVLTNDSNSIEHKSSNEELPATESADTEANISEPLMEQLNELTSLKWDVPLNEVVQEVTEKSLEQISSTTDDKSEKSNESPNTQNDGILNATTKLQADKAVNESGNTIQNVCSGEVLKLIDGKVSNVTTALNNETDKMVNESHDEVLKVQETSDVSSDLIDKKVKEPSDIKVDEVLSETPIELLNEDSNDKPNELNENENVDEVTAKSDLEKQMLAELVSIIEGDQDQDLENLIETIQEADETLSSLESSPNTCVEESSAKAETGLVNVTKKSKKDGKRITKKNIEIIYEASTPSNVSLIEATSNDEIGHIEEVKSILDVSNSQS